MRILCMRALVSLLALWLAREAQADYCWIPFHSSVSRYQDFEGGRALMEWDGVTGTILRISPRARIRILPPMETEEEARAAAAGFIDSHPELFRVPSASFQPLRVHADGASWSILGSQVHAGMPVLGGYLDLEVYNDGYLAWLHARIYPAADLEDLELEPVLSAEEATAIAIASQEGGLWTSEEPRQVIAFRSGEPVLTWEVWVGEMSVVTGEPLGRWRYYVTADTGRILCVSDTWYFPVLLNPFVRGDANDDGKLDIADPVRVLLYLFGSVAKPPCLDAYDVNDDGRIDIADAVYGLQFLFAGGDPPPKPFPNPGPDVTEDDFACFMRG